MMASNNSKNKISANTLFTFEHFISTSVVRPLLSKYAQKTTILTYHNIPSPTPEVELQADSVTVDEFECQMRFLRDNSFNVIPLQSLVSNLLERKKIDKKTVVITFDDGYKSNFSNAFPILQKYKIPATVFLAVDYIGKNRSFSWLELPHNSTCVEELSPMDWEDVTELCKAGIEIGSHALSHKFMPKMKAEEIEKEILKSQTVIEDKIGEKPRAFAFPFSFPVFHWSWPLFKFIAIKALKKGDYTCCCTILRGHINKRTNPFFLKRIVIGKFDDLKSFYAKLIGGYAWTRGPQLIFQTFAKKYNIRVPEE